MDGLLNESDLDVLGERKALMLKKKDNDFADSLNFSESGKKRTETMQKIESKRSQFTLNPHENSHTAQFQRFNSHMQGNENDE